MNGLGPLVQDFVRTPIYHIKNSTRKGWNFLCGLYWTRTSDPIDVNDVLYQLSQQTMFRSEQKI